MWRRIPIYFAPRDAAFCVRRWGKCCFTHRQHLGANGAVFSTTPWGGPNIQNPPWGNSRIPNLKTFRGFFERNSINSPSKASIPCNHSFELPTHIVEKSLTVRYSSGNLKNEWTRQNMGSYPPSVASSIRYSRSPRIFFLIPNRNIRRVNTHYGISNKYKILYHLSLTLLYNFNYALYQKELS